MLRYFLDTEFNGFGGELISKALAPEDSRNDPFYEAIEYPDPTPWVAQHVLPILQTNTISRSGLADRFACYLTAYPLLSCRVVIYRGSGENGD